MARILLAENDPNLLELTEQLLSSQGTIDAVGSPHAALRAIAANEYDLLLTDLNLGHPGDGLVLAAAMRLLHPRARTILITGYPDFTGALAALQETFDEIVLKPAAPRALLDLVSRPVSAGAALPVVKAPKMSLWDLLARERTRIVGEWLHLVERDPQLGSVKLSTAQRLDHLALMAAALFERADASEERSDARQHGRQRLRHYPEPYWISLEISYLRRAIFDTVLRGLLELDLSRFPGEMFDLNLRLDHDMMESLRAFGLKEAA